MDDNNFVSVSEAARIIGISTSALYQRIKKGDLEAIQQDGVTKLCREELTKVFESDYQVNGNLSQDAFKTLIKQLEILQNECETKNRQIEELHQQLDHLTQLLAMKEKNTQLMLTSAEKKSLWRKLFLKEKKD